MKKIIILFISLLLLVGCGQKDVVNFDRDSTLEVEGLASSESLAGYEVINEISEKENVQKVIDIFSETRWQKNVEIQMEREPDLKLNNNYHIWRTPQGDTLEIINTNNSDYAHFSISDSSELYVILTGKEMASN